MNIEYLKNHWSPIYETRFDWAIRANQKFLNSLEHEDVKKIAVESERKICICTIGNSQVGKTSLILKLLGIKQEKFNELSDALRGRALQGNPATPTAIIYSKSEDNHCYYLEDNSKDEPLSLDKLEKKLEELRQRVEKGEMLSDKPMFIKIAKNYFEDNANFSLEITDLPGEESSNLNEQEHVKKVLEKYSRRATSIIFVSKVDQIVNLNTKLMKSSYLDITKYYPEKCKAVFTHSFSADSVKISVKKELSTNGLSKERFREIINPQLFNNIEFFPLEYGKSFEELKGKISKEQMDTVTRIIESILDDLKKDIEKDSNDYTKLIQNSKLPKKILELKKEVKDKANNELNKLKKNLKNALEQLDFYKKSLIDYKESIDQHSTNIFALKNKIDQSSQSGKITILFMHYIPEKTRPDFISKIHKFCEDFSGKVNAVFKIIGLKTIQTGDILNQFSGLLSKLNGYSFDNYWSYLPGSDWDDDKNIFRTKIDKCVTKYNNQIEEKKIEIKEEIKKQEDLWKERKLRLDNVLIQTSAINDQLAKYKNQCSSVKQKLKEEKNKLNSEYEKANSFFSFLEKEYEDEIYSIKKTKRKSKEKHFFQFMHLALLNKEYKIIRTAQETK